MGEPPAVDDPLAAARRSLERGEYGRVLTLLEPIAAQHGPATSLGAGVRLLMATALMGQGEGERAAACCRSLQTCADPQRRAQARGLLQILEAPSLKRPREWSLTLPRLDEAPPLEGVAGGRRARSAPPSPAPERPPVGPTQSPRGFVALVVVVLLALLMSSLLSGCMRVETRLAFRGPGRLQLQHRLEPIAGTPLPFQRRLASAFASGEPAYEVSQDGATTILESPPLTPINAAPSLSSLVERASSLAGLSLPAPDLDWRETNWLLGVDQRIRIRVDLSPMPPLPGLEMRLRLTPLSGKAIRGASPLAAQPAGESGAVIWPLRLGQGNTLEIRCWRWNPLGLGGLAIAVAFLVVVLVQRTRVRMGMGLPELPA